jgi:chemotaxis-related protein WspD
MSAAEACWTEIGVSGDRSCPELRRVIHCRNCAIYARAGRTLLDQPAPTAYLDDWAAQLAAAEPEVDAATVSVVIFRVGDERFALPTAAFVEAVERRSVHRIPHRGGGVLLGLVNIGGELQLCVSLAALLGIAAVSSAIGVRPRLAVIERAGERWAFPVDELIGVRRIAERDLVAPPATVARDAAALTQAVFTDGASQVAFLDLEPLCAALRKAVA